MILASTFQRLLMSETNRDGSQFGSTAVHNFAIDINVCYVYAKAKH
jgi:hypothetical protein